MPDPKPLVPTQEDLLPCPFCGKQPTSQFYGEEDGGYWGIDCFHYHAHAHEDTEEEAVAAWNTRLSAQPEWRPIGEAPRDGTKLWGWDGHRQFEMRHVATTAGDRWHDLSANRWAHPTHFMFPPAPPASADGEVP